MLHLKMLQALEADTSRCNASNDRPPLVIVEGFLGGGAGFLWGKFEQDLNRGVACNKRKVIFSRCVPSDFVSICQFNANLVLDQSAHYTTELANYTMHC